MFLKETVTVPILSQLTSSCITRASKSLDEIHIHTNRCISTFARTVLTAGRDDLLSTTMCGILFCAHLGKTPDTESEEFFDFLSRLRDANAFRGE